MNNIKLAENTLGQRIRMGYTQEQLAEIMCVPKTTLSAYENDKVDIKGSILVEMSKILFTTPNYLLGIKEDEFIDEMTNLLRQISDLHTKKILLMQMGAIINM